MQTADVLHVEQNLSVVPMNSSSLTKACEIFRYEEGKYVMPQSAADYLTSVISERTQFSVVSIIGTYRKGKSTFLNFLQQSEYPNPFNVSSKAYACTKGIWGWYDTTHNILYLDVEGSDAPTMTKAKWCEYRMNALAVMLSSVLLYWHWEGAISSNLGTLNALCLFAERLRAFTHEGGTQGLELHLPALLWLFRNWEDSGIDIVPSREYVKEQVGLVDETLAEYLDQFPAFVALDLPRPVNGRMTPEVLEDHTNQTEEYRDRLKDIQGILGIHKAQKVWTSPKTFITLCRGLEYVVNQEDFVPTSLSHACSAARDALMDEVRAHALGIYTTSIEKIEIPITDTQLQKALDEASAQAKSHFRRNMLGVIKEEAIEHYALDLEPEFQRRCVALKKMNRDQSVIHCQSLIPGLQAYYYNEMNAVELPYPEDALRATHERLLDEVLKRYDKLATGSHEVRAEYRSEFQNALTSVFHERAHLNASEIACSQIVPKAHNVFVQQCNSVFTQTVMSDDAIVTFLEEAHQKAVAYYHTETKSYHPNTVHIHEQELEKLTRKDFQTVTSNNALRAQQVVMQQLPYMIMYYRDTMTSRLAANILPGDALQRIHTETMTETFKKMSDFCAPFCSPPVSNALHQPSVINEYVRTAEVALKDELQAQYKTFEKSNSTRAHELAQRLVDVSHTVYEKNMRLVIQPVSSNILESAHYDNQLTALENFLSKAVGSLEEIHTFENRLRDMINRTYLKIRLENAITSNESFLMKRSRFLLAWYGRYFILAEGLLKVFDLSTLEKKLIDTVPVSSIEEVTYSDVLPSKKGSEDAQKEIEEARSLHGRSLSMNSEPRSAVRMRDSEGDIEQWEYGLMVRAVNHHTMYLVAGTERDREVWFLALRNACGLQT